MSLCTASHTLNAPRNLPHTFETLVRNTRLSVSRGFSSTATHQRARISPGRKLLLNWLRRRGNVFRRPLPGSTNYLSAYDGSGRLLRVVEAQKQAGEEKKQPAKKSEMEGEEDEDGPEASIGKYQAKDAKEGIPKESGADLQPFPLNPHFISEAVLSEPLRDEIYKRVVEKGQTVREVSIALSVSMERVGAVVRLRTVEQDWIRQGKNRATFYQRAVLDMLPQTPLSSRPGASSAHESINDLTVHPSTLPQIFHPTSESRHFTREDAGRVFNEHLLPADQRIPHPEMIEAAKDKLNGMGQGARERAMRERLDSLDAQRKVELQRKKEEEAKKITTISARRWDFRFKNIKVDETGHDERSRDAVGHRYGFPHEDRKKGQMKIPTHVD